MAKAEKAAKSGPEYNQATDESINRLESPEGWEDEQISFPPYWNPQAIGNSFRGFVVGLDERDPEFPRYVLRATVPIKCQQGPAADAEIIEVSRGELFTTSVYVGLPLDRYLDEEVFVIVKDWVEGVGKGDGVWKFRLLLSPDARKRVHEKQLAEDAKNPLMSEKRPD